MHGAISLDPAFCHTKIGHPDRFWQKGCQNWSPGPILAAKSGPLAKIGPTMQN